MKSRSIFAILALCVGIVSCQPQEATTDDTDSTMMSEPDNTRNTTSPDTPVMGADTGTATMDTTSMDTGGGMR